MNQCDFLAVRSLIEERRDNLYQSLSDLQLPDSRESIFRNAFRDVDVFVGIAPELLFELSVRGVYSMPKSINFALQAYYLLCVLCDFLEDIELFLRDTVDGVEDVYPLRYFVDHWIAEWGLLRICSYLKKDDCDLPTWINF